MVEIYFYSTPFWGRVYKWKFCLSICLSVCLSSLLILFLQTLSSRNIPQSTLITQPLPRLTSGVELCVNLTFLNVRRENNHTTLSDKIKEILPSREFNPQKDLHLNLNVFPFHRVVGFICFTCVYICIYTFLYVFNIELAQMNKLHWMLQKSQLIWQVCPWIPIWGPRMQNNSI